MKASAAAGGAKWKKLMLTWARLRSLGSVRFAWKTLTGLRANEERQSGGDPLVLVLPAGRLGCSASGLHAAPETVRLSSRCSCYFPLKDMQIGIIVAYSKSGKGRQLPITSKEELAQLTGGHIQGLVSYIWLKL